MAQKMLSTCRALIAVSLPTTQSSEPCIAVIPNNTTFYAARLGGSRRVRRHWGPKARRIRQNMAKVGNFRPLAAADHTISFLTYKHWFEAYNGVVAG